MIHFSNFEFVPEFPIKEIEFKILHYVVETNPASYLSEFFLEPFQDEVKYIKIEVKPENGIPGKKSVGYWTMYP